MNRIASLVGLPLLIEGYATARERGDAENTSAALLYEESWSRLEAMIGSNVMSGQISKIITDGLFSILSAQVIGSWTAFEALATDLWIASVNIRPRKLGLLLAGEDLPKESWGEDAPKGMVPLAMIGKYGFDLRKHMGDALESKFMFSKNRDIARAYRSAFGPKSPSKGTARNKPGIADIFDDKDLAILNATRNVLVHKAGVADKEFCGRIRNHSLSTVVKREVLIPLTGSLTASLCAAACRCAEKLVLDVDEWLVQNPD